MLTPERLGYIRVYAKTYDQGSATTSELVLVEALADLLEAYDAEKAEHEQWEKHALLVAKFLNDMGEMKNVEREQVAALRELLYECSGGADVDALLAEKLP